MRSGRARPRGGGRRLNDDPLRLGVLDPCNTVVDGRTPRDVLLESQRLCALADRLGYSRYWVGEHHGPQSASGSPSLLVPALAARTRRILVGTGGVVLPYYSPFKVAADFRLLHALHPGRVELGIARGPVSPRIGMALLDAREEPKDLRHEEKVRDLLAFLGGGPPGGHRFAGLLPVPAGVPSPPVWLLGSGAPTLALAADLGAPVAVAALHDDGTAPTPRLLREHFVRRFRAASPLDRPRHLVTLHVLCAPRAADAQRLVEPLARRYGFRSNASGTPEQCREVIEEMADRYGTREVLVTSVCLDPAARARSYRLLAKACGLERATSAPRACAPRDRA